MTQLADPVIPAREFQEMRERSMSVMRDRSMSVVSDSKDTIRWKEMNEMRDPSRRAWRVVLPSEKKAQFRCE